MSIVVKKFTVQTNGKKYEVGETISKLKPEDEKRLVGKGYCDYVTPPKTKPDDASSKKSADNPPSSDQNGAPQDESGPNTSIPLA